MAQLTVNYHSSVPRICKSYYAIDQEAHAGYSNILSCFQRSTTVGAIRNMDISCLVFGHQTQQ